MLVKLKDSFNSLQKSEDFKKWKEVHTEAYLTSCFLVDESGLWQFDYFNPDNSKITSFQRDKITVQDQDVFQAEETKLKELNLENVDISYEKVLGITEEILKKKYSNEDIDKKIVILQTIEVEVWNITYLTKSFNVINFKIDAKTGNLLKEIFENITGFKKK